MLPPRPQELRSKFLFIGATLQTENFGAMIKKPTVTDLVKGSERIWRYHNFKIIVADVVVGEVTARAVDAEEERPIRAPQKEASDSSGRGYYGGRCTVTNRHHPEILAPALTGAR